MGSRSRAVGGLRGALPLLLFSLAHAAAPKANSPAKPVSKQPQVKLSPQAQLAFDLLSTPEDKINIGDSALLLSTLMFPDSDVRTGRETLDALAARVAQIVNGNPDPEYRIRVINTVLYLENGFSYDFDNIDHMVRGEAPELRTFWYLLRTHKGSCASLPVLWYAVAERLGYPVFAVTAPQHWFLRYDDGRYRSNIETTSGGGEASDEKTIELHKIPAEGIRSGAYMHQLSKREFLASLVGIEFSSEPSSWLIHDRAGRVIADRLPWDDETAVAGMEAMLQILPWRVELHWGLAFRLETMAIFGGVKGAHDRALEHAQAATRLGVAEPIKPGYWKNYLLHRPDEQYAAVSPKPVDLVERLGRYSERANAKIARMNLEFARREAEFVRAKNEEHMRRQAADLWAPNATQQDPDVARAERVRAQNNALLSELGLPNEPPQPYRTQRNPNAFDLYGPSGSGPARMGALANDPLATAGPYGPATPYVRDLYGGAPGQLPGGPTWTGAPYGSGMPGGGGSDPVRPFAYLDDLTRRHLPPDPLQPDALYRTQPNSYLNDSARPTSRGPGVQPRQDPQPRGNGSNPNSARPWDDGHQAGRANQPFCARFAGLVAGNPCVLRQSEMGVWSP